MKQSRFAQLLALALVLSLPAWAQDNAKLYRQNPAAASMFVVCEPVAGVLTTNINAIALPTAANGTNLGPVFGDLQGAVAATQTRGCYGITTVPLIADIAWPSESRTTRRIR